MKYLTIYLIVLLSGAPSAGDELEFLRPNVYRNVARQLNITVASENIVSDAFLAVAADIFSTGGSFAPWTARVVKKKKSFYYCYPIPTSSTGSAVSFFSFSFF